MRLRAHLSEAIHKFIESVGMGNIYLQFINCRVALLQHQSVGYFLFYEAEIVKCLAQISQLSFSYAIQVHAENLNESSYTVLITLIMLFALLL